ncbi:reverse transcriptase from mobile element jockey protein, putative, partial [Rhizoctonia solani AG-3 Rhs1AP]
MVNKANAVLSGLSMLANTIRGLSVKHARLLYKACVVPILTYGSLLWFHGRRQKSLTGSLEKAQNVGLRWLLGAFKTTSIRSMEHLASIPPMHVHLHKLNANAAIKLRALPRQFELARRLPKTWEAHDKAAIHTRRTKLAQAYISPIKKLAELSHPNAERRTPYLTDPWTPENPYPERLTLLPFSHGKSKTTRVDTAKNARRLIASLEDEGTLIGFADGSKKEVEGIRRVGIGYSITWKGEELESYCRGIGPRADNYDAEMFAAALLAQQAVHLARERKIDKVHLFSDNQSVVQTILSLKAHPAQLASIIFREEVLSYLNESPDRSLTLQWIPGHSDISGNDRADQMADFGTQLVPTPIFECTATWQKCHATDEARATWLSIWNNAKRSEHSQRFIPNLPSLKLNKVFTEEPPPRRITSRLVQLITGHGFFGEYRNRLFPDESPSCSCGESIQTVPHLLFHCPHTEAQRPILSKVSPDLNPAFLFAKPKGLRAVYRFIEQSGIGRPI